MIQQPIPVVRIKIASEQPAESSDPRVLIGYRDGLTTEEIWERGRAAWRLRAEKVLACERLIIAHAGVVRMVGTIEGVSKYQGRGDRLAVLGEPLPNHPLIGKPDPMHNTSQNPIAYGTITMEEDNA